MRRRKVRSFLFGLRVSAVRIANFIAHTFAWEAIEKFERDVGRD